jgi:hypothetical protein
MTMSKAAIKDVLEIPTGVWESADSKEELEDWLLAHNPKAIQKLRQIRDAEDVTGQGKSLSEVARRWNIKL